jgi:hypothetical protein
MHLHWSSCAGKAHSWLSLLLPTLKHHPCLLSRKVLAFRQSPVHIAFQANLPPHPHQLHLQEELLNLCLCAEKSPDWLQLGSYLIWEWSHQLAACDWLKLSYFSWKHILNLDLVCLSAKLGFSSLHRNSKENLPAVACGSRCSSLRGASHPFSPKPAQKKKPYIPCPVHTLRRAKKIKINF